MRRYLTQSWAFVLCSLLLCPGSVGCAPYWRNRLCDLEDVAKVNVGAGLGVDVQVTDFVHPSFGIGVVTVFGHESREVNGICVSEHEFFPLTVLQRPTDLSVPDVFGASSYRFFLTDTGRTTCEVSRFMIWKDYYATQDYGTNWSKLKVSWVRRMWCEAAVGVYFLPAVRIGVNPAEALDLVLGFTTLDIAGDDVAVEMKAPAGPETGTLKTPSLPHVPE